MNVKEVKCKPNRHYFTEPLKPNWRKMEPGDACLCGRLRWNDTSADGFEILAHPILDGGTVYEVAVSDRVMEGFASGAIRQRAMAGGKGAIVPRYDLVSPVAWREWAMVYGEGAPPRYPYKNWEKGLPSSDCLNRALGHILMYMAGDRSEKHLSHAMWNLGTVIHFDEVENPADLNDPDYEEKKRINAEIAVRMKAWLEKVNGGGK